MPNPDWYPRSLAALDAWHATFSAQATATGTTHGLTAGNVTPEPRACWSSSILKGATRYESSQPDWRLRESAGSMKKANEAKPEYDFSKGVRGKHAEPYRQGTNLVALDEDLARKFPKLQGGKRRTSSLP